MTRPDGEGVSCDTATCPFYWGLLPTVYLYSADRPLYIYNTMLITMVSIMIVETRGYIYTTVEIMQLL